MKIRPVEPRDRDEWLRMREAFWPEPDATVHPREIDRFFAGKAAEPQAVLVAEESPGRLAGLAELSIRPYADGCVTDRVGYLEGWWVDPGHRRRGLGRQLVEAAKAWARSRGCREFASDTDVDNAASFAAHLAVGFEEAARLICFRTSLDE